jgi:hypothetical protein
MTMQVGMIGTDGILIASDTRTTNTLYFQLKRWRETFFQRQRNDGTMLNVSWLSGVQPLNFFSFSTEW